MPSYSITSNQPILIDKSTATQGETVTVSCTNSGSYLMVYVRIGNSSGTVYANGTASYGSPYTFTMPASDVYVLIGSGGGDN